MLTLEEFEKIMNDDSIETTILNMEENSALVGLNLIAKYLPNEGIAGANHDIIYGADIEDLINAGITIEDTIKLNELNWFVDDGCLQKHV